MRSALTILVSTAALAGCEKDRPASPAHDARTASSTPAAPRDARAAPSPAPPDGGPLGTFDAGPLPAPPELALTKAEEKEAKRLGKLIARLRTCPLEEWTWDDESCPGRNALAEALDFALGEPASRAALRRAITDPSPTIRLWTQDQLLIVDQEVAAAAIAREQDPFVLVKMIEGVGRRSWTVATTRAVLAATDHPDPDVRTAAVTTISQGWPTDGLARMIDRAEHDPDDQVRAAACESMGWAYEGDTLAAYDRLMVATTPARVYEACFDGLVAMWRIVGKQEAYDRVVALIASGRHDVSPTDAFRGLHERATSDDLAEQLIAALATWAGDRAAPTPGRIQALAAMGRLHATPAQLEPLRHDDNPEAFVDWLESLIDGDSPDWIERRRLGRP